jgi:hypothetical protein
MGSYFSGSKCMLIQLGVQLGAQLSMHNVGRGSPDAINSFTLIPSRASP